jgi:hypothetical protein
MDPVRVLEELDREGVDVGNGHADGSLKRRLAYRLRRDGRLGNGAGHCFLLRTVRVFLAYLPNSFGWQVGQARGRGGTCLNNGILVALLAAAFAIGKAGVILLFAFGSFTALREFMTLTPTRRGDHYALAGVFFVILPAQYVLIWIEWYGLYSIFIPVYAFFFRSWPRCEATPSASWSGLPRCSGG